MKRIIAMGLLFVGLGLAAAAGSRNGADHVEYRQAQAELAELGDELVELQEFEAELSEKARALKVEDLNWGLEQAQVDATAERAAIAIGEEYAAPERTSPFAEERQAVQDEHAEVSASADLLQLRKTALSEVKLPTPMTRLTQWLAAGGVGWFVGVLMILAGAVMARQQLAAENSGEVQVGTGDAVDFLTNVQAARKRLDQLAEDISKLGMDEEAVAAREEIDLVFAELLEPIVDARGRFVARHGMATFAGYFGSFAGGERNLSRTWSALTDGHAVEARASLERAREAFAEAEDGWNQAESKTA
ncbi:MAG: hypothetical protein GY913_02750 [Proteobacteria bacterium]|nr:hypothetical protein [Pseudomonadota bacterium]MCP4915817.1 hypothetical protein [Pseudomonadota bacterium]